MPTPSAHLAASLEVLKSLQSRGLVAVHSRDLSRVHRQRLARNGFLQEVMRGWYIPTQPGDAPGDSTAWYAAYWSFVGQYLESRFGDAWCVSSDQSLMLHVGNRTVPPQLLVRSPKGSNNSTPLPYDTSVFDMLSELPAEQYRATVEGVRLFTLPAALVYCTPDFFRNRPIEARAALSMLADASDLLRCLLDGGKSKVAGRLAGALRNVGRDALADQVRDTFRTAGYTVVEVDPFDDPSPLPYAGRQLSPYVGRMRLMWATMRGQVLQHFPASPAAQTDPATYLKQVEDIYRADAYHSLSIEGYRVSDALIERVRSGTWNPDNNEEDKRNRNALAARGYWQAFQRVKAAVERVLAGENAGTVADRAHSEWYRELFGPSVAAGILQPADLAGYRNGPVYIRRSLHVPPPREAVRDLMPEIFQLLSAEPEPAVRVVLGHFFFVWIHPYFDGNGRMGRFLMNLMVASGGWRWTLVTVDTRNAYMAALERASVHQDIEPFTQYLAERVEASAKL